MRRYLCHATILSLLSVSTTWAAQTNVKTVPAFMDGLNVANVLACETKYQKECPAPKDEKSMDEKVAHDNCVTDKLAKDTTCLQASKIRELTYYPPTQIKKYGQVSVFNNTALADGVESFYMVDIKGHLIGLTDQLNLSKNKTFAKIKKKFPNATLTTMLAWEKQNEDLFPKHDKDANKERLVFKQVLSDGGCVACAQVGTVEVAYDFTLPGVYLGASVVNIIKK
jgi:hypothetical protein